MVLRWHTQISIHAPTRGATNVLRQDKNCRFYFNPRSHERSDLFRHNACNSHMYFNPRSHERSDLYSLRMQQFEKISIHAPTRGATGSDTRLLTETELFQSTLPREERHIGCGKCDDTPFISIHAPTRGATMA